MAIFAVIHYWALLEADEMGPGSSEIVGSPRIAGKFWYEKRPLRS